MTVHLLNFRFQVFRDKRSLFANRCIKGCFIDFTNLAEFEIMA
jgi:hypothetical protein